MLAALLACALAAPRAAAQTPLDCATVGQSVCEDGEILALEGERAALAARLAALDPLNPALALEQTWLDGLGACGEDAACYRTAYLNHNQVLRQTLAALPGAAEAPPRDVPVDEAPPDAAPFEPLPAPQEERAPRQREQTREPSGDAYVAAGPGWGFFAAFAVTFLILHALLRARRRNREELRALEDAPQKDAPREDAWRF